MEALAALPPELVALVIPLLLAYLRVQAAVLVFPVLSERVLSVRVRTAIAMMLAPVALSVSGSTGWSQNIGLPDFGATASLSQLIGTGTEAAPHPIGVLMHMAGLALLMAMGLPILLLDLLGQSYGAFPAGQFAIEGDHGAGMVGLVSRSFVVAMALASPFILGGLLYQVLTGVVNRVMPSLPVVFIGAPAIIMLALVGLALLAPAVLSGWAQAVFDHAMPS